MSSRHTAWLCTIIALCNKAVKRQLRLTFESGLSEDSLHPMLSARKKDVTL